MGAAASVALRPEEIADLCDVTGFLPPEVRALYKRFQKLDRGRKGVVTSEDLLMLPELSTNPLASRIVTLFDPEHDGQITFSYFLSVLAVFSGRSGPFPKQKCESTTTSACSHGMQSVTLANDASHVYSSTKITPHRSSPVACARVRLSLCAPQLCLRYGMLTAME